MIKVFFNYYFQIQSPNEIHSLKKKEPNKMIFVFHLKNYHTIISVYKFLYKIKDYGKSAVNKERFHHHTNESTESRHVVIPHLSKIVK